MTDLLQLPVPAGLTDAEAARKLAEQGPNTIAAPEPPSTLWRVVAQLRDPMILLLLGAAVLTATLHDLTDLAVILIVIVLNTTVGVLQELRAEHALAALNRLAAPHATVLRSGRAMVIGAADVPSPGSPHGEAASAPRSACGEVVIAIRGQDNARLPRS